MTQDNERFNPCKDCRFCETPRREGAYCCNPTILRMALEEGPHWIYVAVQGRIEVGYGREFGGALACKYFKPLGWLRQAKCMLKFLTGRTR